MSQRPRTLHPKTVRCRAVAALFLTLATALAAAPPEEPESVNYFNDLTGDAWVKANQDMAEQHFKAWLAATGQQRVNEAGMLAFYAWRAERYDLIDRLISGDRLAETETRIPAEVATVAVETKHEAPVDDSESWPTYPIWRRITPTALEIWTPAQGWLFGRKGDLLHTARPPRNGGRGREWFGAFLPDGQWITTELLEGDGRVYIFNTKGRCTHEIKARALMPPRDPSSGYEPNSLIPWARSNRTGDAWVVRVGSEGGRGEVLLSPDGSWKQIKSPSSPWRHCLTRQLGVRLLYGVSGYICESDDGKVIMQSDQPSHGIRVGYPDYSLIETGKKNGVPNAGLGSIHGDGRRFGFWPGSHAVYVLGVGRTWFHDANGNYQGWIAGQRVGDAADSKGMIFRLKDGRTVSVSPDLKSSLAQRFTLPDGTSLTPLELHPDLGLGFFALPKPADPDATADAGIEAETDISELLRRSRSVVLGRWSADAVKRKE